ncbi:MAG TPA: PEP-CTERM sorting domain-containing protein [Bryobacteraceae bacterium]|nr:PEP-CTERM sorting domain-containing protein [Bryobacteraceae bacterium]
MFKILSSAIVLGCCSVMCMSATPVDCTTLSNLQQYVDQSALGGCFVQDKLFTGFTYTGGGAETASDVKVSATLSTLPGIDIHGFTLVPDLVWTADFTVGYTISVMTPNSGVSIVAALDQINLGPLGNATTAVSTKSNGEVYNLNQSALTQSSGFSGVNSLSSMTSVTIPEGSFLISLEEQYTQTVENIPEPGTLLMITGGLLGLGFFRRRKSA